MSDKRFKITNFIIGITVGILVGALLVFFIMPKSIEKPIINEDNLVKKISNNVLNFLSTKQNKAKRDSAQKGKSLLKDITYSQKQPIELDEESEGEKKEKVVYKLDTSNQNIEVKKDELIKIITLDVEKKSLENTSKADSILHDLAGVAIKKAATKLLVEFWQSPINYKGYQLSKNKLVVFGLNPNDVKKVVINHEKTYLLYSDWAYKLDFNTDFKSLEKANINDVLR